MNKPIAKEQLTNATAEVAESTWRENLLDELCGDDTELKREIQDLLTRGASVNSFLHSPLVNTRVGVDEEIRPETSQSFRIGSFIGPYKLVREAGRGGMGLVFEAEQKHPVARRVALKIVGSDRDSRDFIARFETERQALAIMQHPNIARILDAGTTGDGYPFFVMEYVEGLPLTKYCDREQLSLDQRLRLFVQLCAGVQHAHQKGVIHRDLKPSNVIVTRIDGKPIVKVIDFGLAKALSGPQSLTKRSIKTEVGQLMGTLKYMSPEQASLDTPDVDTRSDIFSLGIILFELLTGETPMDDLSIHGQPLLKTLDAIRSHDPPRPAVG